MLDRDTNLSRTDTWGNDARRVPRLWKNHWSMRRRTREPRLKSRGTPSPRREEDLTVSSSNAMLRRAANIQIVFLHTVIVLLSLSIAVAPVCYGALFESS